jgi:hypothetical protein
MTVKQLNIKSFTNTAVTFTLLSFGSVGFGILFLLFSISFAQKKEQIGTETVNVKPYTQNFGCF